MSIDIQSENLLNFSQAAKILPGRPHISTIHRWRLRGVGGVKLESCLVGGRRFTSREALQRFASATTAAANGEPPTIHTPRQQERSIRKAEEDLARDGI